MEEWMVTLTFPAVWVILNTKSTKPFSPNFFLRHHKDYPHAPEKYKISVVPDFKSKKLDKDDEFMILGCDGIWETMSDEEIIRFVKVRLDKSRQNKKSNSEQVMGNLVEILLDNLIAPDT